MSDAVGGRARHGLRIRSRPGMTHRGARPYPRVPRFHDLIPANLTQVVQRCFAPIPADRDRYGRGFFFAAAAVLTFTLVVYWALTVFPDVKWFAGEDGASEWWSVGTYLAAAVMATVTSRSLARLGHHRLGWAHLWFAAALLIGAMEEISWGQRLLGWSTPEALERINVQDETSFHNLSGFDSVLATLIFCASAAALAGAVARVVLHARHRVTTADFLLPSLVLAPALLMIMFWIGAVRSFPGNVPHIVLTHYGLDPVGSEIPEVLMGLCLCVYAFSNWRRAARIHVEQGHPLTPPRGRHA